MTAGANLADGAPSERLNPLRLNTPILTPRLVLDTLDPLASTGPYARWMQDADVIRFLEVRFHRRDPHSLTTYIEKMNESEENLLLGMFLRADNRHIGNIKLGPIRAVHRRGVIGILIGERGEWKKGYASEAVAALADYAFAKLGLHRLEAGFCGAHQASVRAFEKAGFQEEARLADYWLSDGVWDDQIWMARLADRAQV